MDKEQSIRERLKNGQLVGGNYTLILRPPGEKRAVILIEGVLFTVEDSNLMMVGGMTNSNKRKKPTVTVDDFDTLPQLTKADFFVAERKHVPRNYGQQRVPSFTQD